MNALPRRTKVLSILLIFLLLDSFALGALAEVAPKYVSPLLLIVFTVVTAFGIIFYYNRKREDRAHERK